ncbi:MAG: helix-turn-helix domain-containing protein, partial [Ktedonobacterales bacterium]
MSNNSTPGDSAPLSASLSVGAFIRQHRRQLKMTQRALADGKCSAALISRIETGHAKASQNILRLCADRLGVRLMDFPTGDAIPLGENLPQRIRYAETAYTQASAEMLLASGDIPTAARTLRTLRARLGAHSSKTLIWLCAYVACLEGNLGAARQELAIYANADAPDDSLVESAALHWLKGLIASAEKTYSLAVAEYEQAITDSAESYTDAEIAIEARVSLADTLLRAHDLERAYAEQT